MGRETSGTGAPCREEPGADIQALSGLCWRRAVGEGSLRSTGQADLEPRIARGLAREGEITSAPERVEGRVRAFMLDETHDRRIYEDITGGQQRGVGGRRQVMWGRVIWQLLDGPIIDL